MLEHSEPAVSIVGLTYAYGGRDAVKGLSFEVGTRSIHGFVGPNGAGKTTTLKVLATLLKPDSGSVLVFGKDVVTEFKNVRREIGFMPDHFSMYRQMTVFEYLDFFGAAYGIGQGDRDRVIADVLSLTDMTGRRNDLIRSLSRGMQQRVSLARVLVHDPKLLLLDEPASGLDPRARIELMEILQELRTLGKTIFISSHILSELATLCDHVTILDRGSVKYTGTMRGLIANEGDTQTYALDIADEVLELEPALRAVRGVADVRRSESVVHRYLVAFHRTQCSPNAVLKAALETGASVVSFREDLRHLNDAFMDLTEPGVRT